MTATETLTPTILEDLDRLLPAVFAQYRREARPPTQRAIDLTIADLHEDDRPAPSVTDTPYR